MPATLKVGDHTRSLIFSEIKALDDEQGIFEGYLSVFGNSDSYKDIVDPGSFKQTLLHHEQVRRKESNPYLFPILWQHNPSDPIGGFLDAYETDRGLYVKGELDLEVDQARRAYRGLKKGYMKGLSIGYDTIIEQYKEGYRHLKEIRLWEGSIVTFPANDLATVDMIKAAGGSTSYPLAPRNTSWSKSSAVKQLKSWAGDDETKLNSVYFWHSSDGKQRKMPFCRISSGSPQIVFKAVQSAAGAINGARGGVSIPSSDIGGVKSRISSIYSKAAKEFDDDTIKVPWSKNFLDFLKKSQDDKARRFDDVADDRAETWCIDDYYDIMSALSASVLEIAYDDSEADKTDAISESIDQFKDAMVDWAEEAQEVFLGGGEDDSDTDDSVDNGVSYSPIGFMSSAVIASRMVKSVAAAVELEKKVGKTISAATQKKLETAMQQMSDALKQLQSLLGTDETDDSKSTAPAEEKQEETETTPLFIKVLAEAMSTQPHATSPETKAALATSDIEDDVKLMELVKRISSEVKSIVA